MSFFRLPKFSPFLSTPRKTTPFLALMLAAALLFALATPQAKALGPHGDLFAGYNYLSARDANNSGWQIDGHLKLAPFLGAEAGVTSHSYDPGGNAYLYLFGPRATVGIRRVHLFAHFLIGGEHSPSISQFVYDAGAGLDYSLTRHIAWRVEADVLHEPNSGVSVGSFTTGPALHF